MKKLEDITYRHELIERYLDADTSVEEEQALAEFYRHCEDKDLTDEDLDIRNLMLGMENYTPNFHQTEMEMMEELDGKEEMKELDRKEEEADGQPDMKEIPLGVSKKHETRWVRLSAILLATAMLAGLIFLLFPIKDYFSSSSEQPGLANLVPTEQVVRSQPSSEDEDGNLNAYEKMERADSLFLAATQDIVTPQEMKSNKIALTKRKDIAERSENHAGKTAENTEETSSGNLEKTSSNAGKTSSNAGNTSSETERSIHEDFNQIYEVASAALPSAEQLIINRQGDNIVISTLDNEGNMQHYTINAAETQDGSYQLLPLAQLNDL
ncbi:hypothetical protein [Segatella copri]|uniref:hypothetical protein n=1 Tax=Segatella copri TaxID=165179 RepID=UPI001C48173F|nr:hypothetical protein [Segatella copri]MBW0048840.1 hypothetical protein [Segatella copri]